jgi:hypothetical protein
MKNGILKTTIPEGLYVVQSVRLTDFAFHLDMPQVQRIESLNYLLAV